MNQQKIGKLLRELRKEKGMTQEQLAEHFLVSSRTVSRWETGNNMPDLSLLIELADFYDVDIREIINGERRTVKMDNETKETLKKAAEYAEEESKHRKERLRHFVTFSAFGFWLVFLLFRDTGKGMINGLVPPEVCSLIMDSACGFVIAALFLYALQCLGVLEKIYKWKISKFKKEK